MTLLPTQIALLRAMKDGTPLTVFTGFSGFTPSVLLVGVERFSVRDFQLLYERDYLAYAQGQLGRFSTYVLTPAGLQALEELEQPRSWPQSS